MRTYRIAEGTLLTLSGDLTGKEIHKGGIYVNIELVHCVVQQNEHNIVKQLHSSKN